MKQKLHTKEKGLLGELLVASDLISKGFSVFSEFGDNSKIDLIAVDKDYNCFKIQVKSFEARDNKVVVKNTKSGPNYFFKYSKKHFDICAVYVPNYNIILYISAKELLEMNVSLTIRMIATKNNQKTNINYYEKYLCIQDAIDKNL
jgi:hypothetical protein